MNLFDAGGHLHVNLDHVVMIVDHGNKIEMHLINGTIRNIHSNLDELRSRLSIKTPKPETSPAPVESPGPVPPKAK